MEPFLKRYYERIDRHLGDEHASSRYPLKQRYDDLLDIDSRVFNQLLRSTGRESLLGYAEVEINFLPDQDFYAIPFDFARFLRLEQRVSGAPTSLLPTKNFLSDPHSPGVVILSRSRGFRVYPTPIVNQTWTLCCLRQPGLIHYARATHTAGRSLTSGTPPADGTTFGGVLVPVTGYYNGMELHIIEAGTGVGQKREIVHSSAHGEKITFTLRHPFDPPLSGEVWYEIMPTLPPAYDAVYAYDASLEMAAARRTPEHYELLKSRRNELWNTAVDLVSSTTMDRPETQNRVPTEMDDVGMPY